MIQLIRMAFRDLGRNKRRSFLSAFALSIGLALLLLMAATIEGMLRSALDTSINLQSGHLQLRAPDYDEDKLSLKYADLVSDPQVVADKIAGLEAVKVATPRLYASGIAISKDKSLGVRITGVDPDSTANAPFKDSLLSGTFLSPEDRDGVVIGKPLADKLGLQSGDKLRLLVNTTSGEVDEQDFTIRGIFSTKTPSFDETTVFLSLVKAQAITRTENYASIIFILLKNIDQTDEVAAALQTGLQVKTYKQLNELLTQFNSLSGGYMVFLYLIVLSITATVIVNALVMAVFERTREIGILSAIGMKSWRIMFMFFAESSILAIGGILMGLVLGMLIISYTTANGLPIDYSKMGVDGFLIGEKIYTFLTLRDTLNLSITAFIVTLLGALYPALLAAQMEPVEALHGAGQ
ncbi:MAG: ABC transporter permease [Anaerolineaceae bacterium]|nr:ABC transporter permease [Anaerolineaceae bacterium]